MGIVIGINACRNRSGGSISHLIGILRDSDPTAHGISQIHVWSYKRLLDALPDAPWLVKHNPAALEQSLPKQVWWEYHTLPKESRRTACDLLLNTDAGSVCYFRPAVVMSRDMLSYEPLESRRYGISKARMRLFLVRFLQTRSMRRADGVIFLTNYAANVIQKATGQLKHVSIIPHGIGADFRQEKAGGAWPADKEIRCLYVSNAAMYKHQWFVVQAIAQLRQAGHNISLFLVGGGSGRAQQLLDEAIGKLDPERNFVHCEGAVRHQDIPQYLAAADLFIFASSCENMPNTLVEAMASGLPIACSDRGPMPEVLEDGGLYFDPENPETIADAVNTLISDRDLRMTLARRAWQLSKQYSWARCAGETWRFLQANIKAADLARLTGTTNEPASHVAGLIDSRYINTNQ